MTPKKNLFRELYSKQYFERLPYFKEEKARAFTTLSLTLAAVAFFAFFAISPTLGTIAQLRKQLDDSRFVDNKLGEKINNLGLLQQQYDELTADLPVILQAIPQQPTPAQLTGQLYALARDHKIAVNRLQVFQVDLSKPNDGPKVSSFTFALDAQGSLVDLMNFTLALGDFDRIVTLDNISLSKDQRSNEDALQLSVRGMAYFKK